MIGLLVAQLAVLRDSRQHIVAQDRKINRIVQGTQPALRRAKPVVEDVGELVAAARPVARELRTTLVPLLRELCQSELAAAIDATARLVGQLEADGRLPRVLDDSAALLDALRDSRFLGRTLRAADLVPLMAALLNETVRVQKDVLGTQRSTRSIQLDTLRVQRRTLKVQKLLIALQREALVHIRSIDRKTGGQVPAAAPAVP
jgi:hypothetical protein